MNKLAFVGSAVGVSLAALLGLHLSQAADHLDSSTLGSNPMADINDVYAWMTSDGAKVNLALTVSPRDDGTRAFGPSVLYTFHVTSKSKFPIPGDPPPTAVESKVICKFASDTSGECWVVNEGNLVADYVTGDFSATTGVSSPTGKLRVFAGRRSDPFFFNFGGFVRAVEAAVTACGGDCPGNLTPNAAGCPDISVASATALRTLVSSAPTMMVAGCPAGQFDCFATLNVMAIVVQIDKGLVLSGSDTTVSVWASTHAAQ